MTLDAPRNPILRPFASMNTGFFGFLQIGSGSHPQDSGIIQGAACIQQGICTEIQGVIVGQGHDIYSQLLKHGYMFRRQPEGKLLISSSCSAAAEGEFLICHKDVAAVNHLAESAVHHSAYIACFPVCAQHMV